MATTIEDFVTCLGSDHPDYYEQLQAAAGAVNAVFLETRLNAIADPANPTQAEVIAAIAAAVALIAAGDGNGPTAASEAQALLTLLETNGDDVNGDARKEFDDAGLGLAVATPSDVVARHASNVAAHEPAVRAILRRFFNEVSSPFAYFGVPRNECRRRRCQQLQRRTASFLGKLAPLAPTIDQVAPFVLLFDDYFGHLYLQYETSGSFALVFPDPPLSKRDLAALGLVALRVSLVHQTKKHPHILFPLELPPQGGAKLHAVFGNNPLSREHRIAYVALKRLDRIPVDVQKRLFLARLSKTQEPGQPPGTPFFNELGRLVSVEAALGTGWMQPSIRDEMVDAVNAYNECWKDYFAAETAWRALRAETTTLNDTARLEREILLLDLSRFGFAPCWSTPKNTPLQQEDGRAAAFENDLGDFKAEKPIRGQIVYADEKEYKICKAQTAPQWRVARYMTGVDFLQILRQNLLAELYAVQQVKRFVGASDESNTEFKTWLAARDAGTRDGEVQRRDDRIRSARHYATDDGNDAFALGLCFSEIGSRSRASDLATNAIQGHVWDFFHSLRLVSLKAASTPMHAALRRPTREWAASMHRIATFLKVNVKDTKDSINTIVESRRRLVEAFLAVQEQKNPGRPVIEKGGLLAGQATLCFDRPSLFVRIHLRATDNNQRTALLKCLRLIRTSDRESAEDDIEDKIGTLIAEFHQLTDKAKQETFRAKYQLELKQFETVYGSPAFNELKKLRRLQPRVCQAPCLQLPSRSCSAATGATPKTHLRE